VLRNEYHLIGRALDDGALGVVVPLVNSAAEAKAAVQAARYPPAGARSAASARVRYYGEDYVQQANSEIMVVVMIETREAVGRVEEIAAVPGVDCLMIGPGDLSLSLGCFGAPDAAHAAAIEGVVAAGRKAGVSVGMACGGPDDAVRRAEQGMLFLAGGSDWGWAIGGAQAHLAALQAGLGAL